jgi:hypothetical protein
MALRFIRLGKEISSEVARKFLRAVNSISRFLVLPSANLKINERLNLASCVTPFHSNLQFCSRASHEHIVLNTCSLLQLPRKRDFMEH